MPSGEASPVHTHGVAAAATSTQACFQELVCPCPLSCGAGAESTHTAHVDNEELEELEAAIQMVRMYNVRTHMCSYMHARTGVKPVNALRSMLALMGTWFDASCGL